MPTYPLEQLAPFPDDREELPIAKVGLAFQSDRIGQYSIRMNDHTALHLSKFFDTTPDFWFGNQMEYDLKEEKSTNAKEITARVMDQVIIAPRLFLRQIGDRL